MRKIYLASSSLPLKPLIQPVELIERLVSNGSSDDPSLAAPEASAPTAAPAATAGAASSTAPATTSTGTAAATTEASTTDATPGPSADVTAAEELKKRQDRAKRFGTTVAEDETKKTERAQRFGEVNSDAKMLKVGHFLYPHFT